MSRYIDADALIDRLDYCVKEGMGSTIAFTFKHMVEDAPSIDIVRCGECKHNYNTAINHGKMNPRCDFMDVKLKTDDFCSYGERREP